MKQNTQSFEPFSARSNNITESVRFELVVTGKHLHKSEIESCSINNSGEPKVYLDLFLALSMFYNP